jgi:hypothetical protein
LAGRGIKLRFKQCPEALIKANFPRVSEMLQKDGKKGEIVVPYASKRVARTFKDHRVQVQNIGNGIGSKHG